MKIFKTAIVVLFLTCICAMQSFSQTSLFETTDLSNTNTDLYSDEDLIVFYNKIVSLNIGEQQGYQLLKQKGLPDSEILKLKTRLGNINTGRKNNNAIDPVSGNNRTYDSTGAEAPMENINKDLSVFGSELFVKNSLVFEPNLRIATPSSYILGPDDEIVVSVYGFSEQKYNLRVNAEGDIYIPNVGPLFVSGLSIEAATQKIKSKLASTIYRAISSGQTKVQVSLGKIRSIRVTVIGQAHKPGTYTISSLTTLYNLLYLCGGPDNMGSFRNIELIRGNEVKRTADLYAFLVQGNQKDNILLQEGDVVRIPYYKTQVKLSGEVKRQGKYELLENETFANLLQYSGGFNDFAYKAAVSLIRITDKEKKIVDLKATDYTGFKANAGDEYFIGRLQDKISNRIAVTGSVLRPGNYELTEGLTLKSLIDKAGGVTEDAFTERISIFRYNRNKMPSVVSVNLDSAIIYGSDLSLLKDDSVSVHSIFDFSDNQYVRIEGNVRQPGIMRWRENLSLQDVLLNAGGVNDFGDSSSIEISRRIRNADVTSLNYTETDNFVVSVSPKNNLSQDVKLRPFDIITVKNLPGLVTQRTVMVLGDVIIPGKYSLQKSGDKISDIIKRVGGFRASADSSSITIRRSIRSNLSTSERENLFQRLLNVDSDSLASNQRLRNELYKNYDLISVNLTAAIASPAGSENLVLEDGDVLTIDKNNNLVKVSGEVYYPTIIPAKPGKNARYYIDQAGSFMPSARKSGAFVIYPDGKAKSVKSFLWFKSYPRVTPRSEVFVPQKNNSNRGKIGIGEMALLVSALGIVANVIITTVK
jgi:protein involved in polysaccharide export with SLBB domain